MNWQTGKPTRDGKFLVYAPSGDPDYPLITTAWWSLANQRWELLSTCWGRAVTHWMPLPEPPEGT